MNWIVLFLVFTHYLIAIIMKSMNAITIGHCSVTVRLMTLAAVLIVG